LAIFPVLVSGTGYPDLVRTWDELGPAWNGLNLYMNLHEACWALNFVFPINGLKPKLMIFEVLSKELNGILISKSSNLY
jgi:hypothetical protein